ncbi:MAG TPA: carboxypeptidase regulatory-like domain-containing protein, partial [Vicinamibacterales bacterium]
MKGRTRAVAAWVVILVAAIMAGIGASENTNGKSFPYLDPAFTQHLFGSTSSFKISGGNLGGVAVLPNGDVVVAECVTKDTRLHKFLAATTIERRSTTIHPETIVPSAGGCGLTYHPDGSLYLNMDDGAFGVANVNANGTTRRLFGPRGNALGIAVDPITNHLVYAGRTCRPGQGSTCTLFDLDPVTGVATNRAVLLSSAVGYVDGIAFDPTGGFIFLANRYPQKRLTILTRAGAIVQHVAMTPEPIGIWFHSDPPAFVVTNNMDGSMSRFDFPGNVYAQPPAITKLADQGFRGDLIQAGADGCLYVTQGGSRYDNGDVEDGNKENSIVQICAGFAVPPGLTPAPPAGTLDGTVTDLVTTNPIAGAMVLLSDGTTTTTTDSAGHYSFTLAPGTYDVTVTATGYNNAIANGLVVTNRHTTTQDFTLTKPAGTLTGVVTDTTGALVTTATITLSTGLSTGTDGTGSYSFTLPPGTYGATVTAPGYNSATASGLVVTGGGTTTKDFRLVPLPGTLQGIVTSTNPAGTPIV